MQADTTHRQGCDALGGYGHGVGQCTCGAADTTMAPTEREQFVAWAVQDCMRKIVTQDREGVESALTQAVGQVWDEGQMVARAWQAARAQAAPQGPALIPQPVAYYNADWTLTPHGYEEMRKSHPDVAATFKPAYTLAAESHHD